jgi:hypothetical protein
MSLTHVLNPVNRTQALSVLRTGSDVTVGNHHDVS